MIGYEELKTLALRSGKIDEPEFVSKVNKKAKEFGISLNGAAMMVMNEMKLNTTFDKEETTVVLKRICDLKDGDDYVEVMGTIVNTNPGFKFYEVCSACGKSIKNGGCKTHGPIKNPAKSFFYGLELDDGTGIVKATLFPKQFERLCGMKEDDVVEIEEDALALVELNNKSLGMQVIMRGKYEVSEQYGNKFSARLVFTSPEEIAKRKGTVTPKIDPMNTDDIYEDDKIDEEEDIV